MPVKLHIATFNLMNLDDRPDDVRKQPGDDQRQHDGLSDLQNGAYRDFYEFACCHVCFIWLFG